MRGALRLPQRGRIGVAATVIAALIAACAVAAPDAGSPRPPARQSTDDALPPEVRWRILEAAVVDALRRELYFSDAIRARLDQKQSLRDFVMRAAGEVGWSEAEAKDALPRIDAPAGRTSLASLLPEQDDPEVVGDLVRLDLLRAAAPLAEETRPGQPARDRTIAAAKRLLKEHLKLPGGAQIWGKVDDELDRKIRGIVASRMPRSQYRRWCELAGWLMLAQDLDTRALGMANESVKWMAETKQPASLDFAAVRIIALRRLGRSDEAKAAAAAFVALPQCPADLRDRVQITKQD